MNSLAKSARRQLLIMEKQGTIIVVRPEEAAAQISACMLGAVMGVHGKSAGAVTRAICGMSEQLGEQMAALASAPQGPGSGRSEEGGLN